MKFWLLILFVFFHGALLANATEFIPFDDEALSEVISENEMVVIYAWNPYMPLSVKGLSDHGGYFLRNDIIFVPVLDATYRGVMPELSFETVYYIDSDFLIAEDIENHFPAYFLFNKGRLVKKIFGHMVPERLERLL